MTFTKEQIYNYVEENLHNLSDGYIIDIFCDEIGGNHVGFMSDFDEYVRYAGFLDTYKSLSSGFDPDDEYFCYDGDYESSDDLSDFIEMDDVIEWITNFFTSEDAEDIDAGTEYGLYELWKPLKEKMDAEEKPKHTEEEIEEKLTEYVNDIDIDYIVTGINKLPNNKGEYKFISEFAEYMSENYENDEIVAMIVKSAMNREFEFQGDFFAVEGGSLRSYEEWEVRSLFRNCINDIPADFVNAHAPKAQDILNGIWEE